MVGGVIATFQHLDGLDILWKNRLEKLLLVHKGGEHQIVLTPSFSWRYPYEDKYPFVWRRP